VGRRHQRLAAGLAAAAAFVLVGFATSGPVHRTTAPVRRAAVDHRSHLRPVRRHAPRRPSQFLVVSFDGAGGVRLWPYWRAIARRAGAHFTFFVSGVYLLDEARRKLYRPPRHTAGSSDIGFAQPQGPLSATALVRGMVRQLALAYREGHELGTHFGGHFCAPYSGNVGEWTAANWRRELDEFDKLLFRVSANNRLRPAVRLPFGPAEVIGERTPCLQGNMHVLLPVLAARGFRYDASQQSPLGTWPRRERGLWELPLLEIPFAGHTFRVLSMDYNFFANQTIAGTPLRAIERETYVSLWRAFRASYFGNRAPLSFANHFETWNEGAYDRALARVLLRACRLPEVRCVSFRELVDWLDVQPRARLRRYRLGRFPRFGSSHRAARPPLNRRHTAAPHRLRNARAASILRST
jgi:peptidoglycan/xylan/chitin deacetylase (PgdA/CDA1 family)